MTNSVQQWNAHWIWYPGRRWTVNYHFLARRAFALAGSVRSAALHISAYTDYQLYVNGECVGRGPHPSDPSWQSYDSYDVASLLQPGPNVVAVIAHNDGIGTHWQHRGPGGLIAQLEIETAAGHQVIATDDTWHVEEGRAWSLRSPRMFWSAGFTETFDFNQYPVGWVRPEHDDSAWSVPEVIGPHPTRPWLRLVAREIPLLRERPEKPVAAEKGTFALQGLHCIRFDGLVPAGENHLAYAQTHFLATEPRELILHLECDDAFKAFVNNRLAAEQSYSEEFSRTRVWRGRDEYEQVHHGMGPVGYKVRVRLRKGWNKVLVVVDQDAGGWGFTLAWLDPVTGNLVNLPFAAGRRATGHWLLAGPCPSTGLNDSLDAVATDITRAPAPDRGLYIPFDYTGVTDHPTLMRYEIRRDVQSLPGAETLHLRAGQFCVVDLGVVRVGYPQIAVNSRGKAILDVGYSYLLPEDHSIHFSNGERLKYADRVHLRDGDQIWQPALRRTGRYIHISCRQGEDVEIRDLHIRHIGYPVEEVARFECADLLLNRIWEVSRYTTELLMQYGYQDCLKREQGTLNTSSFNYASRAAACCFGDYALARKTLRLGMLTQNESGWFDSHGISSPNQDEPTECLWWIVWLRDYYLYSGDQTFVAEMFEGLEDNLRYWAKAQNRYGLLDGRNFPIQRPGQLIYLDDVMEHGPYAGCYHGELSGLNMLYCAALRAAAYLARELGVADRASFYERKAARVLASLSGRLWDPARGVYLDWRQDSKLATTAHPIMQITAAYFGLGDEEQMGRLLHYLTDELGLPTEDPRYPLGTFGFYYYFLEVLFRHGRDDLAFELLRRYYGTWLAAGATAFGEHFRLADLHERPAGGFGFGGGMSDGDRIIGPQPSNARQLEIPYEYEVHAYGTSAHLHFYSNILGVQPLAPGFREVLIAPQPGDLPWAQGIVATPQGPVGVSWQQEGSALTLDVEAPQRCMVHVRAPARFVQVRAQVNQ